MHEKIHISIPTQDKKLDRSSRSFSPLFWSVVSPSLHARVHAFSVHARTQQQTRESSSIKTRPRDKVSFVSSDCQNLAGVYLNANYLRDFGELSGARARTRVRKNLRRNGQRSWQLRGWPLTSEYRQAGDRSVKFQYFRSKPGHLNRE